MVQSQWNRAQASVPSTLYHYTTLDGMRGILDDGAIWASDVRYLNDSSELVYAESFVHNVLREQLAGSSEPEISSLVERFGDVDLFERGDVPFIACFCEAPDLLSQWRGYTRGEDGVALGLRLGGLHLSPARRMIVRRVVYNESQQHHFASEVVKAWRGTWTRLVSLGVRDGDPESFDATAAAALELAVAELLLCYKHPAFQEEAEWRVIKLVDVGQELAYQERLRDASLVAAYSDDDLRVYRRDPVEMSVEGLEINFRKSHLGLTPYVALSLAGDGEASGAVPLTHVRIGPGVHRDLARSSVGQFLRLKGYGEAEVTASSVPLRG